MQVSVAVDSAGRTPGRPRPLGDSPGDLCVVTWGSTLGAARTGVMAARRQGLKVGHVHLRYVNPLPNDLGEVLAGKADARAPSVVVAGFLDANAALLDVAPARKALGPEFEKRHGFSLSFNAFFLRAAATALVEFPEVNAILDDRGIVQHRRAHLGMAVALEPSGLVVPVIRDAQALSVRTTAVEAQRLATRARERRLTPEEMQGGTFTVTNPGAFGNAFGTPIIHQPQAAILDFGAIRKRVVVVEDAGGADAIAIRPMCFAVLAWKGADPSWATSRQDPDRWFT